MKIRLGFVGNSSSSSFMIYGVRLQTENLLNHEQEDLEGALYEFRDANPDREDIKKLEIEYGPDSGYCQYVGRSWDLIGDDETGTQFRENTRQAIKDFMLYMGFTQEEVDSVKFGTQEESWYDG